jgi:hypothetical protein
MFLPVVIANPGGLWWIKTTGIEKSGMIFAPSFLPSFLPSFPASCCSVRLIKGDVVLRGVDFLRHCVVLSKSSVSCTRKKRGFFLALCIPAFFYWEMLCPS